jgi:proteasome lid subunit RPN8/RPN11
MSNLKIDILGRNDNNNITDKEFPEKEPGVSWISSVGGARANHNMRILFEPSSIELLFDEIKWGSKYKQGDVEQAGLLIGNYYRDNTNEEELLWADVVVVIPADAALVRASKLEIEITAEAWRVMREKADIYRAENLQILGWYHTHPDNISTRFSGTDTTTQRNAFTSDLSFGVVFNPNQKCWSAFYGADSKDCVGNLIITESIATKYEQPKIQIKQVNGDSELQEDGVIVHYDSSGQIVNDIPTLSNNNQPQVNDETLPNQSTFSSLRNTIGGFFVSIGEGIQNSQRRSSSSRSFRKGNSSTNVINKNSPKIDIKNINKSMIKCRYYSMNPSNDLIEQKNFALEFSYDNIMEIINHKNNHNIKDTIYGEIKENGNKKKIIISLEPNANVIIYFGHATTDDERLRLVGLGSQGKINIEYAFFINDENPHNIDVVIVHFTRGKIL